MQIIFIEYWNIYFVCCLNSRYCSGWSESLCFLSVLWVCPTCLWDLLSPSLLSQVSLLQFLLLDLICSRTFSTAITDYLVGNLWIPEMCLPRAMALGARKSKSRDLMRVSELHQNKGRQWGSKDKTENQTSCSCNKSTLIRNPFSQSVIQKDRDSDQFFLLFLDSENSTSQDL